jgi:type III restriction enzyme
MGVKFEFDADLQYQIDAIESVVGVFSGQQSSGALFDVGGSGSGTLYDGEMEYFGNKLNLVPSQISDNIRVVQGRNSIPDDMALPDDDIVGVNDFSVEMETGTGKTYVYLRSAMELNKRYGFSKFVVVVPSVAIREGVLSNLRFLQEHFQLLYGQRCGFSVYDSKNATSLRSFALSSSIEILVINIDSFNKSTNLIMQGRDSTNGVPPIDFIRGTNPIVFVDEPQNMESDKAKDALKNLNPLATFRFSATHVSMPNPLYRLTPVDAYNANLVKQIEVWPVLTEDDVSSAYIEVVRVSPSAKTVTADVIINVSANGATSRKKVKLKPGKDGVLPSLHDLSGGRHEYKEFGLEDIKADPKRIIFANGIIIPEGGEHGANKEHVQKVAIETAIKEHFEKELKLQRALEAGELDHAIKPLTLFFIDKVSNFYPPDSKFRKWFEEEYTKLVNRDDYTHLNLPPVEDVYDGYFAVTPKGEAKDSSGAASTASDEEAYELIMKDKERLLSPSEPLRFIWSHSALREGWDNPNVFVIATLNDTKSTLKKRQEIGRGLRLPVMVNGKRCFDEEINKLTVVANESYEDFASQLQKEIEADTSVKFNRSLIKNKRKIRNVTMKDEAVSDPVVKEMWESVSGQTAYKVKFDKDHLVSRTALLLAAEPPIPPIRIKVASAKIEMDYEEGVTASAKAGGRPQEVKVEHIIPDVLQRISSNTQTTRETVHQILQSVDCFTDLKNNPEVFIERTIRIINSVMSEIVLEDISYNKTGFRMLFSKLTSFPQSTSQETPLLLDKSVFSEVIYDSEVEKDFATQINNRDDVIWFMKLPSWFLIDTPAGKYNPDWVICHQADGENVIVVKETKGEGDLNKLRKTEQLKIRYGKKHFAALGVDYDWVAGGKEGGLYSVKKVVDGN